MKRLGRWLLNVLAVVLLLLWVAVTGLWARSYGSYDAISWSSRPRNERQTILDFRNGPGCVYLEKERRGPPGSGATDTYFNPVGFDCAVGVPDTIGLTFGEWAQERQAAVKLGLGFTRYSIDEGSHCAEIAVRYVWPWLLFAALPLFHAGQWLCARLRAKRRRRVAHCRTCSYDLTGNVSGVCPECGTAIVKGNS